MTCLHIFCISFFFTPEIVMLDILFRNMFLFCFILTNQCAMDIFSDRLTSSFNNSTVFHHMEVPQLILVHVDVN